MSGIHDKEAGKSAQSAIGSNTAGMDRLLHVKPGQSISRILIDQNAVQAKDLVYALGEADRLGAPLEHVLRSENLAHEDDILLAHATHLGALLLRRDVSPPDPACTRLLSPDFCLTHQVLPWRFDGKEVLLATAQPARFDDICDHLPDELGPVRLRFAVRTIFTPKSPHATARI